MSISTEWIKVALLVALVGLNGWSRVGPAPAPVIAPVVAPVVPAPGPAPAPAPAPAASGPTLAFSEAGVYVVRIQVGNQQGAIVANIDAPGSYPVAVTAQPR